MARESARTRPDESSDGDEADDSGETARWENAPSNVTRRGYLRFGAITAGVALGVGGSAAAADGSERRGVRFDAVVDAVEDLGADPDGREPIDDAIEATAGRNVLVEFPPGEYLITEELAVGDAESWGIRGTGARRTDVRFVAPERESRAWFAVSSCEDVLVENVTFDVHPDATDRSEKLLAVDGSDGRTMVEDVAIDGGIDDRETAVDGPTRGRTIEVVGDGDGPTDYEFTVDDSIEPHASDVEAGDNIYGKSVEGVVVGSSDSYRIYGSVRDFRGGSGVTVLLDGERVAPEELDGGEAATRPNEVVLGAADSSAAYDLSVSGRLENPTPLGRVGADGPVDGTGARGSIADEVVGFRFSGDVLSFVVEGGASVALEREDA